MHPILLVCTISKLQHKQKDLEQFPLIKNFFSPSGNRLSLVGKNQSSDWLKIISSDQTERNTFEFKMTKTEVLMKVNGGIWVKLDQEQDRVKFSNKNISTHAPPTQF